MLDTSAGAAAQPVSGVGCGTPSRRVAVDEEGAEVLELTEQGFYEVRAQSGDTVNAVVASNVIQRSRT